MNKHDEIRNDLYMMDITIDMVLFEEKRRNVAKYINECEATEKELEEIKAMVKDIGDGGVSFDTSYQHMVFEALMNKVGRK